MNTETTNGASAIAKPQGQAKLLELKLSQIREGENTRKVFDQVKLEELAKDIALQGVLEPALVRPIPDGYELVFGARRFRASKMAGRETILAMVREMDDLQVLDAQVAENDKRADLHPLEEADVYRAYHEKHRLSVEEIAAKVSKSVPAVYARMKLCGLCKEGKEAFWEGKLTASTATMLARIPHEDVQLEALKELLEEGDWQAEDRERAGEPYEPVSARDASRIIQDRFMLRLADAPFDRGDATLLRAAGACTTCPKRTGAQPELFADVKAQDTCTDTACFAAKKSAHVLNTIDAAKKAGQRVLTPKETKEIFPHGGYVSTAAPFVDLADKAPDGAGKYRPWKAILGKDAPAPVLAVDEDGKVHELVPRALANKAVKAAKRVNAAGVASKIANAKSPSDLEQEREDEVMRRAIAALVLEVAATDSSKSSKLWGLIASELCHVCYDADFAEIGKLLGLKLSGHLPNATAAAATKMKPDQVRALAVAILVSNAATLDGPAEIFVTSILDLFSVDVKKIAATVRAEAMAVETDARDQKPVKKANAKLATKKAPAKKKGGRGGKK